MKFSTRSDIAAPAEVVFAHLSDIERYERQLRRRGVDLTRTGQHESLAPGMGWIAKLKFRSKPLRIQAELVGVDADEALRFHSVSKGLESDFEINLISLSPRRTRMQVGLEIRPNTLPARLLVQSLKFSKANLDKRFAERVETFARSVEVAYDPDRALSPK